MCVTACAPDVTPWDYPLHPSIFIGVDHTLQLLHAVIQLGQFLEEVAVTTWTLVASTWATAAGLCCIFMAVLTTSAMASWSFLRRSSFMSGCCSEGRGSGHVGAHSPTIALSLGATNRRPAGI